LEVPVNIQHLRTGPIAAQGKTSMARNVSAVSQPLVGIGDRMTGPDRHLPPGAYSSSEGWWPRTGLLFPIPADLCFGLPPIPRAVGTAAEFSCEGQV